MCHLLVAYERFLNDWGSGPQKKSFPASNNIICKSTTCTLALVFFMMENISGPLSMVFILDAAPTAPCCVSLLIPEESHSLLIIVTHGVEREGDTMKTTTNAIHALQTIASVFVGVRYSRGPAQDVVTVVHIFYTCYSLWNYNGEQERGASNYADISMPFNSMVSR